MPPAAKCRSISKIAIHFGAPEYFAAPAVFRRVRYRPVSEEASKGWIKGFRRTDRHGGIDAVSGVTRFHSAVFRCITNQNAGGFTGRLRDWVIDDQPCKRYGKKRKRGTELEEGRIRTV